jgi:predicted house-cleaning noncanonical NTP pyrophosphatase (MazG superfamily)
VTGKLVRDRIPQLMAAGGQRCDYHVAGPQEYRQRLAAKLLEEAAEAAHAPTPAQLVGELADVLEVVHALAATVGIDPVELERVRLATQRQRGGFAQRLIWHGPTRPPGTRKEPER